MAEKTSPLSTDQGVWDETMSDASGRSNVFKAANTAGASTPSSTSAPSAEARPVAPPPKPKKKAIPSFQSSSLCRLCNTDERLLSASAALAAQSNGTGWRSSASCQAVQHRLDSFVSCCNVDRQPRDARLCSTGRSIQ